LEHWSDIWLNEGFATYAQWLWSEHEDEGTAQQLADYVYSSHPANDPFWTVKPGDPGAADQFADAVYDRGALAIQVLRNTIGDDAFFKLLKAWPTEHRYGHGTIPEFQALAERISGKHLGDLFHTWLFTAGKPAQPGAAQAGLATSAAPVVEPRSWQQIKAAQQH
jgi:aminopeptidase N